jgi:CHAT domain-containing protein
VTSQELADFIEQTIRDARSRIEGIGDEQYSFGSEQKFERLPLSTLVSEADSELLDLISYCAMLRIRLKRLEQTLVQ